MNDQLDHAVRSVLTQIIATTPQRDERPIPTIAVFERPSSPKRPYLMVAAATLALVGIGAVALVNNRGTDNNTAASTPPPSISALEATTLPSVAAPTTVPRLTGSQADLAQEVAYRVAQGEANLAALGFSNYEYSTADDGVTTLSSTDPFHSDERTMTIMMTPGTMLQPEDHGRTPVTVVAQTGTLIRVENHSNNGWIFSVEVVDADGEQLPTVEQLQNLIYAIDP